MMQKYVENMLTDGDALLISLLWAGKKKLYAFQLKKHFSVRNQYDDLLHGMIHHIVDCI